MHVLWFFSLSNKYSMRALMASNNCCKFTPSQSADNLLASGIISINSKRLLKAVSREVILLSAVFIVPRDIDILGTPNFSLLQGRTTSSASSFPILLLGSIKVISSPKILLILPRLISSMMIM